MAQAWSPAGSSPVDRVYTALSTAGCNPRGSPPRITARCPVASSHKRGDKNPSLSLGESPEGKALIYCHAGCTTPQIAEALGLHMSDLFPEKAPKVSEIGPAGRWRATYPYHDADGELLFEVVRFDNAGNKTFRQRRPTSSGKWEWNTTGVTKVLYHLPQVLRAVADGETIIVVEGEKDAENVPWAFGHTATCNPGGAGKWDPIHTQALAGAVRVVIIADDDRAGHRHAATVMRALDGQTEVKAFLPAVDHKDISDHLKAGLGKEQLRPVTLAELEYVDDTPDEPVEDDELVTLAHIIRWDTFWDADHSTDDWVAWPFVPAGRAIALYAPAKAGKSSVILALVAAVATGRPIFGARPCEPTSVLYLDYEMTEADLEERLTELGYSAADDLSNLHYALLPSLPPLNTREGAQAVLALAVRYDAQIVVIDTFGRAVQGEENKPETVNEFYQHTGLALKAAGRAVLRADHSGKDLSKGQRGSSAKDGDVDVVWQLTRTDTGVTVRRTHTRVSWVPETIYLERADTDGRIRWTVAHDSYPDGTKAVAELLDTLDVPHTASSRTAQKALREAGHGRKNVLIVAAQRWRQEIAISQFGDPKSTPKTAGSTPGSTPTGKDGKRDPEAEAKPLQEAPGKHPEAPPESVGPSRPLTVKEAAGTKTADQTILDLTDDPIFGTPKETP